MSNRRSASADFSKYSVVFYSVLHLNEHILQQIQTGSALQQ